MAVATRKRGRPRKNPFPPTGTFDEPIPAPVEIPLEKAVEDGRWDLVMNDVWAGNPDKEGHQFTGSAFTGDSSTYKETMDFYNDVGYDNVSERVMAIAKRAANFVSNIDNLPNFGRGNQIVVTVQVVKG